MEMYETQIKPYLDGIQTFMKISEAMMNFQLGNTESFCGLVYEYVFCRAVLVLQLSWCHGIWSWGVLKWLKYKSSSCCIAMNFILLMLLSSFTYVCPFGCLNIELVLKWVKLTIFCILDPCFQNIQWCYCVVTCISDVYSTACESGYENITDILRELTNMGLADEIQKVRNFQCSIFIIMIKSQLFSVQLSFNWHCQT